MIAALALVFVGCGGDDSGDGGVAESNGAAATSGENGDGGAEPLGQEEFVAAVSEICESATAEAAEVGLSAGLEGDPSEDPEAFAAELMRRWQAAKAVFDSAFSDMRQITPPEEHSGDYDEFLTTTERMMELNTASMEAFAEDPSFTMSDEDMQELEELSDKQDSLMRTLGIPEDCFDEPTPEPTE